MLGRALHRAPIVSPTTYHRMHRCTASAGALGQAPAMQPAVRACSTASTAEARTSNTREPGESGIDKHAAYVDEDGVVWPGPAEGTRKRTVALHIGYLGTNYYGLQGAKELPVDATIERVLERAIFRARMIAAINRDNFHKIKWKRSSRTDKGVHSLSTVIGVRVMVHDERFEQDPEGLGYAAAINSHLPSDIRVFSVQRTTKRFDVRRWAIDRTYEYYLPAHTLGLSSEGNSDEDAQKLAAFRAALERYAGRRAFHNYAGRRSQYLTDQELADKRKAMAEKAAATSSEAKDNDTPNSIGASSSSADGANADPQASTSAANTAATAGAAATTAAATAATVTRPGAAATADDDASEQGASSGDDYQAAAQEVAATEAASGYSWHWEQSVRFVSERDAADPIVGSHYRFMRHFTADDPAPLVPGGQPCLRLEVRGESFMLHQIRHMVGAAVAVARGILPADLHAASLTAPIRVTLPIAPPHTLLLAGVTFSPFPVVSGEEQNNSVELYTGKTLTLREGGRAALAEFRRQTFDPALNPSLEHPDWAVWAHQLLPRYVYATEEAAHAVGQWQTWQQQMAERRAAKEAAAADEAAAVAEAAAAEAAASEAAASEAAASEAAAAEAAEATVEATVRSGAAVAGGAEEAGAHATVHATGVDAAAPVPAGSSVAAAAAGRVGANDTGSLASNAASRGGWLAGLRRGVASAAGALSAMRSINSKGRMPL